MSPIFTKQVFHESMFTAFFRKSTLALVALPFMQEELILTCSFLIFMQLLTTESQDFFAGVIRYCKPAVLRYRYFVVL